MALQAETSVNKSQINTPPGTSLRTHLQYPHTTIVIPSAQVTAMDHTIIEIKTRLHHLEGISYPHNTAISHSHTSRRRESKRTSTSVLTEYTDPNHSAPYTRTRKTRYDTNNRPTRTPSRLDSLRYRSPSQWEYPPYPRPRITTPPQYSHPTKPYSRVKQHSRHTRNLPLDFTPGYSRHPLPWSSTGSSPPTTQLTSDVFVQRNFAIWSVRSHNTWLQLNKRRYITWRHTYGQYPTLNSTTL